MKYILKKDLPFAKAGTEVKIEISQADWMTIYIQDNFTEFNIREIVLRDLLRDGWIEEVKPREIYVEFFRGTNKISDSSFDLIYLRNDARFYTKRFIEVME